jgi:hypothetical protein
MNRTELHAFALPAMFADQNVARHWSKRHQLPIAFKSRIALDGQVAAVKFRDKDVGIFDSKICLDHELSFCEIPQSEAQTFSDKLSRSELLLVAVHGVPGAITVILQFYAKPSDLFEDLVARNPAIRLSSYDLPPRKATEITTEEVAALTYRVISEKDPELYSISAYQFLNSSHILSQLFAQSAVLESQDSIAFLDKIRIIADRLRNWLRPHIGKIERDHVGTWASFYGEKVSFADGGVSRIVSLPGSTPTGVRVGIYTVVPGETDAQKREQWHLDPYIIGDVLSDRSLISEDDYQTDEKRYIEAARYILEPLSVLRFLNREKPRCLLLHGPIQNKFETYAELDPYYIPGVAKQFAERHGLSEQIVSSLIDDLPRDVNGKKIWNSCVPIYVAIQKLLQRHSVPVIGVVERGASTSLTWAVLDLLVENGTITERAKRTLKSEIKRFDLHDELLFGCVLDPGEYLNPLQIIKNSPHRARDRWQGTIRQLPPVHSTMMKTSSYSFPFRVEFISRPPDKELNEIIKLIYHTALLLPNYAFPVGIDIADKYAKIPDWLSNGVSAQLAASIFKRCIQAGDVRLLQQMRTLLGRSPRDFFYRPTV